MVFKNTQKMNKCIVLILLCVLKCPFMTAQDNHTIRTMSFNVRYDNPKDGINNWHNRKENIVKMLKFYDVDIIGMQELLKHQLKYLEGNLKGYGYVGVGREDGKIKGEFAPIFYKKEKYRLVDRGTFWLSETPDIVSTGWDASCERIVTWAIMEDNQTKKHFLFMNTHFDHRGIKSKIESVKLLKQRANSIGEDLAWIITGDFNFTSDTESMQILLESNGIYTVRNTYDIAETTYGPNWTVCGFDNRPFDERGVIDYIFVKGVKKIYKHGVLAEKANNIFLSDHCPVFAELEL